MIPVSTLPRGLLGLLNSKDFGNNPRGMEDLYSATIEVRDLFLLNSVETGSADDNAVATGSRNFVTNPLGSFDLTQTVPNGELWYVWNYRLGVINGAGSSINVQPTIRTQENQQPYRDPAVTVGEAGNPAILVPAMFQGWVLPGSRFQYIATKVTGAQGTITGVVQATRFRV